MVYLGAMFGLYDMKIAAKGYLGAQCVVVLQQQAAKSDSCLCIWDPENFFPPKKYPQSYQLPPPSSPPAS